MRKPPSWVAPTPASLPGSLGAPLVEAPMEKPGSLAAPLAPMEKPRSLAAPLEEAPEKPRSLAAPLVDKPVSVRSGSVPPGQRTPVANRGREAREDLQMSKSPATCPNMLNKHVLPAQYFRS